MDPESDFQESNYKIVKYSQMDPESDFQESNYKIVFYFLFWRGCFKELEQSLL